MRVKFTSKYMGHKIGDEDDLPDSDALEAIRTGYADPVYTDLQEATDKMLRTKKKTRTRKRQVVTK